MKRLSRSARSVGVVLFACLALTSGSRPILAQSLSSSAMALSEVETWLSPNPNGAGWRSFLHLDELRNELSHPQTARPEALAQTLQALSSGAPGTQLARFQALRAALTRDLVSLPGGVTALIQTQRTVYVPITAAQVAEARMKLLAALARMDTLLGWERGSANGWAWAEYLRREDLQKELVKPVDQPRTNPSANEQETDEARQERANKEVDVDTLYEILALYTNGYEGLEFEPIQGVARALRDYAELLSTSRNEQGAADHDQRLGRVQELVERIEAQRTDADVAELGAILGELQAGRQAPQLVAALRGRYAKSNLFISVGRPFLAYGIENDINEVAPLRDNILGTSIAGTSRTNAHLTLNLRPHPTRAMLDLNLVGRVSSSTVGRNGPAIVNTVGDTRISGHKVIEVDENGLRQYAATADATTNSRLTGISNTAKHFKRIVNKEIAKRAATTKPASEMIAAQHAEDRLRTRMDEQSIELVSQANVNWKKKFRGSLDRWGLYPQLLNFSTDIEELKLTAMAADQYQLAAQASPPPYALSRMGDINVRGHQSLVNNTLEKFLAGRRVDQKFIDAQAKRFGLPLPVGLKDAASSVGRNLNKIVTGTPAAKTEQEELEPEQRDWSITLDNVQPVSVVFDDGLVKLTIRGVEYTSEDNVYPAMNVMATYRIVPGPHGVKFERVGAVDIYPPDFKSGDTLNTQETALKRLLTKRFEKILKPEFESTRDGIKLTGRWASYGKLYLRAAHSDNGWIQGALAR